VSGDLPAFPDGRGVSGDRKSDKDIVRYERVRRVVKDMTARYDKMDVEQFIFCQKLPNSSRDKMHTKRGVNEG